MTCASDKPYHNHFGNEIFIRVNHRKQNYERVTEILLLNTFSNTSWTTGSVSVRTSDLLLSNTAEKNKIITNYIISKIFLYFL